MKKRIAAGGRGTSIKASLFIRNVSTITVVCIQHTELWRRLIVFFFLHHLQLIKDASHHLKDRVPQSKIVKITETCEIV